MDPSGLDRWRTTLKPGTVKPRTVVKLVDLGGGLQFGAHDNCVMNAQRAVVERVYYLERDGELVEPPKPQRLASTLGKFRGMLIHRLPTTPAMSDEEFLSCYDGRKRKRYEEARDSLGTRPLVPSDAYISSFVKAEKTNFTKKPDPTPRMIHPRSPRYNMEVGKFLKPQEKKIYAAIASIFGDTVVAKGLNADERGRLIAKKWRRLRRPVAIGFDVARFDQHVSEDALKYEHSIYQACNNSPYLRKLLRMQLRNKCYFRAQDGTIKYTINGKRMSGDMNTALGNIILMCAMMWTWNSRKQADMEFLDDGDDCVVIVEEEQCDDFLSGIVEYFEKLGFTLKVEGIYRELEHVVFCQSQPINTGDGYRMVRDPRVSMSKDLMTVKSCQRAADWDYQRGAIAGCGLALAGDLPILGAFYDMISRGTVARRRTELETGMDYLAQGMANIRRQPSAEARYSYWLAFGTTPTEQRALEAAYDAITPTFSGLAPLGEYRTNNRDILLRIRA